MIRKRHKNKLIISIPAILFTTPHAPLFWRGTKRCQKREGEVIDPLNLAHHLCPAFVSSLTLMVDTREVGDNEGDGESYHQYTGKRARAADQLTQDGLRHHVPIAAIDW